MPIETFGGIKDLNPSYPPPSDGLKDGDDHLRGIKASIKASFPNIDDPVSATSAKLNTAASYVDDGTPKLADAGAKFNTNSKDGFENPAAGKVSIVAQDAATPAVKQTVVEFTGSDKKAAFKGPVSAVGPITGPGTVPVGGTILWFSNTLPSDSGWAWANGQKVNVSDNPILAAVLPSRITDSGTKVQLPDLREVTPVGNSTMGGTTARGLIDNFTSEVITSLHTVFGAAKHILTTGQLPKHSHANTASAADHQHNINFDFGNGLATGGGDVAWPGLTASHGKTSTGITNTASVSITMTNAVAGNDEAHNNVQPSEVVNWIIRIG